MSHRFKDQKLESTASAQERAIPHIDLTQKGVCYDGKLAPRQNISVRFSSAETNPPRLRYGEACTIHDGVSLYSGTVKTATPKRTYIQLDSLFP
ncbi:MAG: hypothetical protein AABY10_06030 [Nanoarchaeota archaeon]